jgi:valyl-tRNA synthetase
MLEDRYDFIESEKKWQKFWDDEEIFKFNQNGGGEIYSIDTPPPTVSGSLHIGHIFSYTQAEMIARFQRMQGRNVFYPFGFDDNGLPTERLVEREFGILARDLPREEFTQKCKLTAEKYEKEFRTLWQSLGFSADWSLQYETVNPDTQRISQKAFIELARAGKAYNTEMPVLWCTNCGTSIAQAELETAERDTTFNWIPFKTGDEELLIATTRPELLFGCVALFINPEDGRYNRYIGRTARVPLYNYEIPILGDGRVSMEKGSGIVMCATFGDVTDLEWYKDYKLPYKKVIEADGTICSSVPYIGGLKINAARTRIIELLKENGLLIKSENLTHNVAVHERCGKNVEILPSRQWYIEILSGKERFLEAGDRINWYPAYMKDRYVIWVKNLKWDWCISRQRYFGVPFPVWYCKSCEAVRFAEESELPVNPIGSAPKTPCTECGSNDFEPERSVLDTWATSSISPLINMKWGSEACEREEFLPMSMRTQAHEIIRTWAFYTIVRSLYHTGEIPWKDIMICGFVMAKDGGKISKSKNNSTLEPAELISGHSADAVRYWAANARLGTDTMFEENELKISKRFLTKLWNASRFCIMQLEGHEIQKPEGLMPPDRWILAALRAATDRAAALLREYESGEARKVVDEFFWKDFCDNYLEIVKERLYKPELHGEAGSASARYAIYHVLLGILKLYAPYTPHIVEEIYQSYYREREKVKSIHICTWDTGSRDEDAAADRDLQFGELLTQAVAEVRKYKALRKLSMKAPLKSLSLEIPRDLWMSMYESRKDLLACTGAADIDIREADEFKVTID